MKAAPPVQNGCRIIYLPEESRAQSGIG